MKTCIKCKTEKNISEFYKNKNTKDGYTNQCILCFKEYRLLNRNSIRENYKINYKLKYKNNIFIYKNKNKIKLKNTYKNYYQKNKEKHNKQTKEYYLLNKDKILKQNKLYREKNKNLINEYRKNQYKNNPIYKIIHNNRVRIRKVLKNNKKVDRTINLIGCSPNELKDHLQRTAFNNGYTTFDINNYSGQEYHIDHKVPCDAFNLECGYHQRLCFHWSNLQILTKEKNLKKSDYIKEI